MANPEANARATQKTGGFTRIELLVILAAVLLLALVQAPLLATSREGGHQAVCMNNLRQLGIALQMYSDENLGVIPEEGNTVVPINDPQNADAWYNLGIERKYPRLVDLYTVGEIPLPSKSSIFSCPVAPTPTSTPGFSKAYFMYAMNGRICVNKSTRIKRNEFSSIIKPEATIFLAEADGNSAFVGAAGSNVTGATAIGRHQNYGNFTMADGHTTTLRTNVFIRSSFEASSAASEWAAPQKVYWYPTPTTLQ